MSDVRAPWERLGISETEWDNRVFEESIRLAPRECFHGVSAPCRRCGANHAVRARYNVIMRGVVA